MRLRRDPVRYPYGRLQWVWWGRRHVRVGFYRWRHGMSQIYDWSLCLGPLEVRRWRG